MKQGNGKHKPEVMSKRGYMCRYRSWGITPQTPWKTVKAGGLTGEGDLIVLWQPVKEKNKKRG